jgi:hypothetical protein
MRLKIAFGGKMRSGKDTSADYLIKNHGGIRLSFSEPLYNILHYAQTVCNFTLEKDRWFLQTVGTEWARSKNPNVWIDLLIKKVNDVESSTNIYNSDVRFKNEFDALKKNGFILIKLKRNVVEIDNGSVGHISEVELDSIPDSNWDYVIDNNDGIEELYRKLDSIIINLK